MFDLRKTIMEIITEEDVKNFYKKNRSSETSETIVDIAKGNVLIRTPYHMKEIKNLISSDRRLIKEKYAKETNRYSLLDVSRNDKNDESIFYNVTKKILQFEETLTFRESIDMIIKFKKLLNENFYGALLRDVNDEDIIINPLHILTALSIIDNNMCDNGQKYNLIIYVYNDREQADKFYKTEQSDHQQVIKNIHQLMNTYITKVPIMQRLESSRDPKVKELQLKMLSKTKLFENEDKKYIYYIVASQILTKGIIAPYYSSSLIKQNVSNLNDVSGMHLSPMASVNISGSGEDIFKNKYYSVCTGSTPKRTIEGLKTLTHSNLNSPFDTRRMVPGSLHYVDMMIEKSLELLIQSGCTTVEYTPEIKPYIKLSKTDKLNQMQTLETKSTQITENTNLAD